MATVKPRSGLPSRPSEGLRSRRTGTYMDTSEAQAGSSSQKPRRGPEPFQFPSPAPAPAPTTSGSSYRVASNPSVRRPSIPTPSGRPVFGHQPQSWGSTTSAASGRSVSSIPSVSTTISAGRLQESGTAKAPRNVLRRKPSMPTPDTSSPRNHSRTESARTSSSSSSNPRSRTSLEPNSSLPFDRSLADSPADVRMAQTVEFPMATAQPVTIYPELDRYQDVIIPPPSVSSAGSSYLYRLATTDLPPPTPINYSGTSSQLSAFSGSPSTRFSGSPGPGPYSRDTTPTSMSSQSPGLVAPIRFPPSKVRYPSPAHTRPPVTRRRAGSVPNEETSISAVDPQGLAAVRESLTSSSSNSTVRDRDADKKEQHKKSKRNQKGLSPPPPSPPPRKSSQKFTKSSRDDEDSPSKQPFAREQPSQPRLTSPPSLAKAPAANVRPNPVASPPRASPRAAPARPSRHGTPDLQSQLFGPMPVVHSNLSSTSLTYERRGSEPLVGSPLPRSITPSSLPDRYQQRSRLPVGREPTPAPKVGPSTAQKPVKTESARATRTPSPSTSTFNTRFPFFGRRKTAPEAPQVDKKEKPARKGPAAGTGHEGYGRIGAVRRRSGSATLVARSGFGSQESLQSTQSYDPFLAERVNPVVIAGGEIVENRNTSAELTRTDSNQSLFLGRPSLDSKVSSDMSTTSRDGTRTTLWPSAFPRGPEHFVARRPSDSSESEGLAMTSTLAYRRSVQRLRDAPDEAPLRLPMPINTGRITSPSVNSLGSSVVSDDSNLEMQAEAGRGRGGLSMPRKLTKRARSPRKWHNPFSRSHSQPATAKKNAEAVPVAAAVKAAPHKTLAYYMMDSSEQEDGVTPDVTDVLRDAEVFESPVPRIHDISERRPSTSDQSIRSTASSVNRPVQQAQPAQPAQLPAAVPMAVAHSTPPIAQVSTPPLQVARPVFPERPLRHATPALTSSGRPSRLAQVGRIPKVVSARAEQQTSPKIFSRPFNRVSFQMPPPTRELVENTAPVKAPSPPKPSTPELTQGESTITSGNNSTGRESVLKELDATRGEREFISFSPRKNSICTTGSSSNSGRYAYADTTAVIPDHNGPLAEDEIWDEYNDLLGDDTMKPLPSATSSRGVPFSLETYTTKLSQTISPSLESPTITIHPIRPIVESIKAEMTAKASSVYSADMTERIMAAFGQKPEEPTQPTTPYSVTDFVSAYGNKDKTPEKMQPGPSQRSSASSSKSKSGSSVRSSEDESPLSQVNLRVGSMTVSKWLTFGHVLFSPARDELVPVVGSLKRHSILVIDGLGNDDWSFYAAETYPAATFFNLSPRAPMPEDHKSSSSFPLSPPNHHQIQYTSHLDKFPFGPESFTTVVYRFPAAAPESHYRNVVAEARRVLKPGGYVELSILDVDLNNMGNRGRRAVRRLKERIHAKSGDVSLGSSADYILRLLGKTGFSDIKTCNVGVPVASSVTRPPSQLAPSGAAGDRHKVRDDRSLAEMMNDDSDVADESITNMVAKVGRWWYGRCYESAAGGGPGKGSMWTDRALMRECEEWRTSLKLTVCHARVPDGRARVASI